jgi:large subunit ribosomal protein L6
MSRIGYLPIQLPDGVEVRMEGSAAVVTGPKGTLAQDIPAPITLEQSDGVLRVVRPDDERDSRARHGLVRSLVANMVEGVTKGFEKRLEIQGVGYRASMRGTALELNVGFSHPVVKDAPAGITYEVPTQTEIVVKGIDKQQVGQIAAEIRKVRPPEPYKGKGIRYEGEYVRRKVGKRA